MAAMPEGERKEEIVPLTQPTIPSDVLDSLARIGIFIYRKNKVWQAMCMNSADTGPTTGPLHHTYVERMTKMTPGEIEVFTILSVIAKKQVEDVLDVRFPDIEQTIPNFKPRGYAAKEFELEMLIRRGFLTGDPPFSGLIVELIRARSETASDI